MKFGSSRKSSLVTKTERRIASAANIASGNYTEYEADGTLTFVGGATAWDDLRVSLSTAKLPGSDYPDWVQIADDGASSVGVFGYSFDDDEYVFLTTQLPHSYKVGSTIYPHIHFMATTDVDPADNFGIGIEYVWTSIGDDQAATTSKQERDISTGVDSQWLHQVANIPENGIVGTGKGISSIFSIRLYRYAATSDNYAGAVIITDFDIHFEKDTVGSRLPLSK